MCGKLWPLMFVASLLGCTEKMAGERESMMKLARPLQGIVTLGRFEGQWFLECNVDRPGECERARPGAECDFRTSGEGGKVLTRFLESPGFADEGAVAIAIKGAGSRIEGEGFGHMSMSPCQINLESIHFIELTRHPGEPPPP